MRSPAKYPKQQICGSDLWHRALELLRCSCTITLYRTGEKNGPKAILDLLKNSQTTALVATGREAPLALDAQASA